MKNTITILWCYQVLWLLWTRKNLVDETIGPIHSDDRFFPNRLQLKMMILMMTQLLQLFIQKWNGWLCCVALVIHGILHGHVWFAWAVAQNNSLHNVQTSHWFSSTTTIEPPTLKSHSVPKRWKKCTGGKITQVWQV